MINQERLSQTFLELVRISSPSGKEEQIVRGVLKKLNQLNIDSSIDNFGNIIAKINGNGRPVLLNAHLDTVEPCQEVLPVNKNGLISSKGQTILGADNKAAVAAILETLQILLENNLNHRSLEVVFTLSEEAANLGAVNLDYSQVKAREGFCFDSAMPIGTIILASPYYNRFNITIHGKSAHASRPEIAINVLEILTSALAKIKLGQVDKESIINIGVINAGQVRNSIPGELYLEGEVRSFSEEKLERHSNNLIQVFEEESRKVQAFISIQKVRENSGYKLSQDNNLVNYTRKRIEATNLTPKFEKIWSCSDVNIFRDHNIEMVNLGNGGRNPHTTQETIMVRDLANLTKLIIGLIGDFNCD